jgi:hypothetical protein
MTMDPDRNLIQAYRSARPMKAEILLIGLAAATFFLAFFDLTSYPASNLVGLGSGLAIGAIVSYIFRRSRR